MLTMNATLLLLVPSLGSISSYSSLFDSIPFAGTGVFQILERGIVTPSFGNLDLLTVRLHQALCFDAIGLLPIGPSGSTYPDFLFTALSCRAWSGYVCHGFLARSGMELFSQYATTLVPCTNRRIYRISHCLWTLWPNLPILEIINHTTAVLISLSCHSTAALQLLCTITLGSRRNTPNMGTKMLHIMVCVSSSHR